MISSPSAWATQPATAMVSVAATRLLGIDQLSQPAELGIDLFGRLFADMAGVEQDEIGVLDRGLDA
jgi:hypothetical protein